MVGVLVANFKYIPQRILKSIIPVLKSPFCSIVVLAEFLHVKCLYYIQTVR